MHGDSYYNKVQVIMLSNSITLLYAANIKRLIPQGTVDNNLGPDRSEDPKALDPNYCR